MKVVLSAHFDIARPIMSIQMDDKRLSGLVDNFAGVFVAYQASRKTGVPVFFTNFEELEMDGAEHTARSLDKDTLVIVVDVTQDAENKPAYIGNVYNIDISQLKQKFQDKILFKEGLYEELDDETIIYGGKYGLKNFYFGVPIPDPTTQEKRPISKPGSYHITDNHISLKAIDHASEILIEVIEFFLKKNEE